MANELTRDVLVKTLTLNNICRLEEATSTPKAKVAIKERILSEVDSLKKRWPVDCGIDLLLIAKDYLLQHIAAFASNVVYMDRVGYSNLRGQIEVPDPNQRLVDEFLELYLIIKPHVDRQERIYDRVLNVIVRELLTNSAHLEKARAEAVRQEFGSPREYAENEKRRLEVTSHLCNLAEEISIGHKPYGLPVDLKIDDATLLAGIYRGFSKAFLDLQKKRVDFEAPRICDSSYDFADFENDQ